MLTGSDRHGPAQGLGGSTVCSICTPIFMKEVACKSNDQLRACPSGSLTAEPHFGEVFVSGERTRDFWSRAWVSCPGEMESWRPSPSAPLANTSATTPFASCSPSPPLTLLLTPHFPLLLLISLLLFFFLLILHLLFFPLFSHLHPSVTLLPVWLQRQPLGNRCWLRAMRRHFLLGNLARGSEPIRVWILEHHR